MSSSEEDEDSELRQELVALAAEAEEDEEDRESESHNSSDVTSGDGEEHEIAADNIVRRRAPLGKAIVDFSFSKQPDAADPLQEKYAKSRLPGVPGVVWKDCHPGCYGIAPYWASLYQRMNASEKAPDAKLTSVVDSDSDLSGSEDDDSFGSDSDDLEAGRRRRERRQARRQKTEEELAEEEAKKLYRLESLESQMMAYGIPTSSMIESLLTANDLGADAQPILQAAKGGDVILLNVLLRIATVPLDKITDSLGLTPLHYAAAFGHVSCIKTLATNPEFLAVRGVSLNHQTPGGTAVDYLFTARPELYEDKSLQVLLTPPPELWEEEIWHPRSLFHDSLRAQAPANFDFLLEAFSEGATVRLDLLNQKDGSGRTTLELATKVAHEDVLKILELGGELPNEDAWLHLRQQRDLDRIIAGLEKSKVKRIYFDDCKFTEETLYCLRECLQRRGKSKNPIVALDFSQLTVSSGEVTDLLEKGLAHPGFLQLRHLDLTGIPIKDAGLEFFSRNGEHMLETLILRDCGIGNEGGIEHLFDDSETKSGAFPHLKLLDLTANGLGKPAGNALIKGLSQKYENHELRVELFVRVFGNRKLPPAELKAAIEEESSSREMQKYMTKSFDVLAGETNLKAVADNPPPVSRSRSRGSNKKQVEGDEAEDAEPTPVCSFIKMCPSEDRGMQVPLLQDTDMHHAASEFTIVGARPGGARESRFKATKRKMEKKLADNLARANNIPAPPSGSFAKSDDPDTGMVASWSPEKKMMYKLMGTTKHKTRMLWSDEEYHRTSTLVELARIAQKKLSDLKYAMEATRNGSCPGDETPIVPRTYTLPSGKVLSEEKVEERAKAKEEAGDSDSELADFDDDMSDKSYGFGRDQLTPEEEVELLDKFDIKEATPWQKTKPEALCEQLRDEESAEFFARFGGNGKDLEQPLWKVVDLHALRDDEANMGAPKEREKSSGQRSQGLGSAKVTPVKREKKAKKTKKLDLPENNVIDLKKCVLPEAAIEKEKASLMASVQRADGFWLCVHFLMTLFMSTFAVLWPATTEWILDRLIKNNFGGIVQTEVETAESFFWRGPLPSEEWCLGALTLGFTSALAAASLMQLGFYIWRRLDREQAQGRLMIASLFRVPVLLVTAVATVTVPVCPLTVAAMQFVMCHLGFYLGNVSGASTCSELASWTVFNSFKFFRSPEYDAWPPAETDADMLRAAVVACLFSLMATYASIIHRTGQGHFTYDHLDDENVGGVVQIEGAAGGIGEVNGRYKQVVGKLFQGQPIFSRKYGDQTRWVRQGNPKKATEAAGHWYVTRTSPYHTELDVTEQIHPWMLMDKGCKYAAVSVEMEKSDGQENDYDRFTGVYRRSFTAGSSSADSFFTKQGRALDPAYIVPEENVTHQRTWQKFRGKISNSNAFKELVTALAEVGKSIKVDQDYEPPSRAKHTRGADPPTISKEAARVVHRACTDDWLASLKELNGAAEKVGQLLQTIYRQLDAGSRDTAEVDRAVKAFEDEKPTPSMVNAIRSKRSDLCFQFLSHASMLLLGELVGVDPEKPCGLHRWKLTDVSPDEDASDDIVLRQVAGTGDKTAKGLSGSTWEVEVFGGEEDLDKDAGEQRAWWMVPNLKATHAAKNSWSPVAGRILYNFNSVFGLRVVARTCSVLLDVMFDILVIRSFIRGGFYYFASISTTLVMAPAIACWAFLYAHGMMEAWELTLCVSQTEVAIEAFRTLRNGKVGQNLIWVAVAEACLESLSQTLFQTYCLLLHFKASSAVKEDEHGRLLAQTDDDHGSSSGSMVLVCSVMWGMVNVALVISALDFHGTTVSSIRTSLFRILMRYCEVASRVSSIALFAVYFRPEGGMKANTQRAVFVLLAIDYVMMVSLITYWDRGGKLLNLFWAMMSCLVAPPCFMENFRSFQPVYYATRAVELTGMIVAGVLSRQGPEKLTRNPEARMFIAIFFVSTTIFVLCTFGVLLLQLPAYLLRSTSSRIRAVRLWRAEPSYTSNGVLSVYKTDKISLAQASTKRVGILRGLELEYDSGSVKVLKDPKRYRKSDKCLQLQMQRGEEIVEVARYTWAGRKAGFTLTTNFGRQWGTWNSVKEEEEE